LHVADRIPSNKRPYTTPTHWVYDSGEFQRLMEKCIESSDPKGFAARKKASRKSGKLRGRAVSFYIELGGIFNERMDLRFDPSGTLSIFGGTHSHGQGHATVFAQMVHGIGVADPVGPDGLFKLAIEPPEQNTGTPNGLQRVPGHHHLR